MPDPKELQKKLKNLNSAQFGQVLFELNIDQAIIRENDAPAAKAIEVIRLLEQQPDGLTHLENILKDASSSTASNSNSSRSPEPSPKAPRRSLPLLGVGVGLFLLIVIGFAIFPKAPPPSHQSPSSTSNNNSNPCSEGYKFEGSGPGPSGEYSGWCEPTSSNAGAKRYQCVGQPNTPKCRKPYQSF